MSLSETNNTVTLNGSNIRIKTQQQRPTSIKYYENEELSKGKKRETKVGCDKKNLLNQNVKGLTVGIYTAFTANTANWTANGECFQERYTISIWRSYFFVLCSISLL